MSLYDVKEFLGRMTDKFTSNFFRAKVLDISRPDIGPTLHHYFQNCDFLGTVSNHPVNTVLCVEKIQHDLTWRQTLAEAHRRLKSRGILIVTCTGSEIFTPSIEAMQVWHHCAVVWEEDRVANTLRFVALKP